ncbi:TOMM precursor leader peptide-binding protein [Paenibacillus sp. HJL G12]|uniref:TOMM leader peptide-binding protein n=1 Tax=Paenibacillus dendrobii TaxID=2691084 RepID=A0A7X3LI13_9BACL|nr:TOMM precursor leader peptide-binding protein [Paenibacillus dendrobii]MWV45652.1 TOMM precursor leader peptide-binding protein [Paenibacillus dendrobii]
MKELVLYESESLLLQEVLQELERRGMLYRLTQERQDKHGRILHVITDGLAEEVFAPFYRAASPSSGGVFFYHQLLNTLLVGPFFKGGDEACLACMNRRLQAGGKENLISLVYGERNSYSPHPQSAEFIVDLMEAGQLSRELPERYAGRVEHVQFDALRADSYLLNRHGNCPICAPEAPKRSQPFINGFQSRLKPDGRTYRLHSKLETGAILQRWFDRDSGTITHTYRELRSSMIEAGGMEIRVNSSYVETGFGRAYRRPDAEKLGVLEAVERYCGMCDRKSSPAEKRSYDEVRDQAADPADFGLHDAADRAHPAFRLKTYSEELPVYWTPAYSVKEHREVLVPEQLVYYADGHFRQSSNRFVYDSSNGLALGSTPEEAVLHGLFELIERDNFLCAWYNRLALQELDIEDTGLDELKQIMYFLELEGIRIRFFDITMELPVPSVWAVAYDTRENAVMKAYNAAAAHFVPEKAIESAAMEVITSLPIYEDALRRDEAMQERVLQLTGHPEAVTEFEDHVLYYASEQNCRGLDFVLNVDEANKQSVRRVYQDLFYESDRFTDDDLAKDLEELFSEVIKHYKNMYVVDVTPDEVAGFGFYAAKVLVPGMLPMTFGHQHKRVITERLVRERLRRGLKEDFEMNPEPHPFP